MEHVKLQLNEIGAVGPEMGNGQSHLDSAILGAVDQRWAAQLGSFNFEFKYRPAQNADALSRRPWPSPQEGASLFPATSLP